MTVRFGDFKTDFKSLWFRGEPVAVPLRQLRALQLLIEAKGEVVSRENLHTELWPGVQVEESSLHRCISDLRKALREREDGVRFIDTAARVGYRFAGTVEEVPLQAPPDGPPVYPGRRTWIRISTSAASLFAGGAFGWVVWRESDERRQAKELYRRGRALWWQKTGAAMVQAGELFQESIQIDPSFAPAYSGLADTIATRSNAVDEAWQATVRALELDPKCAEALASQGFILLAHRWQWAESERLLRRSFALAPDYLPALQWLSLNQAITGRLPDALGSIEQALRFEPASASFLTSKGAYLYFSRDFDRAMIFLGKALDATPNFPFALQWRAKVEIALGQLDQGIASWRKSSAVMEATDPRSISWRDFEPRPGEFQTWIAARLEARKAPPVIMALYAAWNKDDGLTLDYLEHSAGRRDLLMMYVPVDPAFDFVRETPRFRAILKEMDLAR